MKNKDIHEWLLDEEIDSLTTIVNMKGESIFIADVLEKHLKEQLLQTTVIKSVCIECSNEGGTHGVNGWKKCSKGCE